MKKTNKRLLAAILACLLVLTGMTTALAATTSWPAKSGIKTYVLSTKNDTTVYQTATSTAKYGTIYATDLITINGDYKNGRIKVTYPLSNGTKTGYIPLSAVTKGTWNSATESFNATAQITTYRRASTSSTLGYISKGDKVYKIATSGNYTQVIYPVSGGYKMGWVTTTDYNKANSTGSSSTINTSYNNNTSSNKYQNTLDKMISGSAYDGIFKENTKYKGPYYGEQCKGFAKAVFEKLYGYNIGSTQDKPNNYKLNINSNKTTLVGSVTSMNTKSVDDAKVKALFSKGRPGDFVQIRRVHGGSHSAILYSVSSTGITLYEANLDNANTIVKRTYTWAKLRETNAAMSLYTSKNY